MSDRTDPPPHLTGPAADAWREVATGDETAAQLLILETLAVQVARARDARARIDTEGLIVADAKGTPVPHPALVIERQAQHEIRAAAAMLPTHTGGTAWAPPVRRR